jgi:hypothetical protein
MKEFFPISNHSDLPFLETKPSIFFLNFAWAHLTDPNLTDFTSRVLNSTFLSDLRRFLLPLQKKESPKQTQQQQQQQQQMIQIFETSSYTTVMSAEGYRRRNMILRDLFVNQLHLKELDEYQITAGKLDAYDRIHFAGVPRFMSVIIALNLICKPSSSHTTGQLQKVREKGVPERFHK